MLAAFRGAKNFNYNQKRKNKYKNTPEPFYLDIHFLHLQAKTSAIPSDGIIACLNEGPFRDPPNPRLGVSRLFFLRGNFLI